MHKRPTSEQMDLKNSHIFINGIQLKEVSNFTYLGSIMSNDAILDKEISACNRKASSSSGRQYGSYDSMEKPWSKTVNKDVCPYSCHSYRSVVCETWMLFRRHMKELDSFHQQTKDYSPHKVARQSQTERSYRLPI